MSSSGVSLLSSLLSSFRVNVLEIKHYNKTTDTVATHVGVLLNLKHFPYFLELFGNPVIFLGIQNVK